MKSILDPTFRYTPAAKTNLAATFKRIRREQDAASKEREQKVKQFKPHLRAKAAALKE